MDGWIWKRKKNYKRYLCLFIGEKTIHIMYVNRNCIIKKFYPQLPLIKFKYLPLNLRLVGMQINTYSRTNHVFYEKNILEAKRISR